MRPSAVFPLFVARMTAHDGGELMFTDEFLRLRVTPLAVDGRVLQSIYGDDDEINFADNNERDQTSSWACQIVYVNAKGEESERQITCNKLEGYGGVTHIQAYCHSRERPRSFKIGNIRALMDLSTGEVVDPASHFDMLATVGVLPFEDKGFTAFTQIALFMARCDGDYHPMEADALEAAITAYCMRFGGDDRMIEQTMCRTGAIAPDGRDVLLAIKRLRGSPIGKQAARLILDHSASIMDADGRHHSREIAWALELSDALKATA